jgi:simple sugar transport system permease protein
MLDFRLTVLAVAAVLIALTLGVLRPDVFLSSLNISSMLLQSSTIGLLGLAVAITMLSGGIDLSVNATANLTAIVVAMFLTAVAPPQGNETAIVAVTTLGLFVGLLVGLACGLVNGFLIAVFGYSPILATLGTMTFFAGVGTVLTGGATLFGISAFSVLGRGSLFGVPVPAIVFLIAALVLMLLLEKRRFGFAVYLVGASESAARYSGVNERRVIFGVYAVSGLLSAIAGLTNLGITNSANVDFGASYVLLAVLLAVLGGIAPSGGAGRIVGVVLAAFILQFLSTGLNLMFQSSSSNFLKDFAWGATLLLVLAIGRVRESWVARIFVPKPTELSKSQPF